MAQKYTVIDSQTTGGNGTGTPPAGVGTMSLAMSTLVLSNFPEVFALCVKGTGAAASAWSALLEGSLDGVNWTTIITHISGTNADGATVGSANVTANLGARSAFTFLRTRLVSVTLGSASAVVVSAVGR